MNNQNDPINKLLEHIQNLKQPMQSDAFKKRMDLSIQSRLLEDEQRKKTGLNRYMSKFLYAIPIAAVLIVVVGVLGSLSPVHAPTPDSTSPSIQSQPVTALNDPEMQEVIQLAFSFESNSKDTVIEQSVSLKHGMIIAYLRQ